MLYLNPHIPTSFENGWSRRQSGILHLEPGGQPIQEEAYYEWRGEWEDAEGNVITYSLFAQGQRLKGYAAGVPKRLVDAARR